MSSDLIEILPSLVSAGESVEKCLSITFAPSIIAALDAIFRVLNLIPSLL